MPRMLEVGGGGDPVPDDERGAQGASLGARAQDALGIATRRAKDASSRHVSVAVPFRAAERNRTVAASVLAGGVAYRIFLWLLPFSLVLGGGLGLGEAESIEDALAAGGIPAGFVDATGDVARASDGYWWVLLAIGVPGLLWAGYTGAKALQLIHALVWSEPPPRTNPLRASLGFTGVCCAFMGAVGLAWYLSEEAWFAGLIAIAITILPLAGLWLWTSLRLPHGTASWKALLPGALLVAVGFQVLHGFVVNFLVPKLEKSTSYYGSLGVIATILFFMYFCGRLVVTAPVLNSSLHEELQDRSSDVDDSRGP